MIDNGDPKRFGCIEVTLSTTKPHTTINLLMLHILIQRMYQYHKLLRPYRQKAVDAILIVDEESFFKYFLFSDCCKVSFLFSTNYLMKNVKTSTI